MIKKFTLIPLVFAVVSFAFQPQISSGPTGIIHYLDSPGSLTRAELIWDQGLTTGIELLSSQDDSAVPFNSRVADDFSVSGDVVLTEIEWWGGYYNGSGPFTSVNLEIYADDGGPDGDPGSGALWTASVPYADCDETYVGSIGNGEMYKYHVVLNGADQFALTGGTTYWLCIQPVMDYPPQTGVTAQDQVNGSGVYFVSDYFGFPDWIEGWQVFLADYDIAFNLYGGSDSVPPTITNVYPKDADYPCGVPSDSWVGFHVEDNASGCDVGSTTYNAVAGGLPVVWATETIDESDPLNVTFDLQPETPLLSGAEVDVSVETYDNAGNGPVNENWTFHVGYTNIETRSVGRIKAGFAEKNQ